MLARLRRASKTGDGHHFHRKVPCDSPLHQKLRSDRRGATFLSVTYFYFFFGAAFAAAPDCFAITSADIFL
jgi:hypothetical protein